MSSEQESPENEVEVDLENQEPTVDENTEEETVEAEAQIEEVSIEELQKQLTAAEQKAAENLDKALRVQADMENLKRRTSKDLENAHKFALDGFSKEMVTVIDSLELGLQAITGDSEEVKKFREGSELTLKQFEAAFTKFNIEKIDPTGEAFNPELHQAMAMQPSEDAEPNTVLNTFQKGYSLNGRLIRPAMVVVAKAAE
ncbi:MAG: nucleotide exchange factor GrpE [Methylococcaceae bacterium]|nr:nucleotide exchange factor GrpE [Methylococcaceae bacterium]